MDGKQVIARREHSVVAVKTADGEAALLGLCYADDRITGDGTLQHPLRVREEAAEPLTIAYVAMGAASVWREHLSGAGVSHITDRYEGQLGFIDAVIEHAGILDRMANERDNELSCVFAYEIAEAFGERFARALFDDEDMLFNTPRELAEGIAQSIFEETDR